MDNPLASALALAFLGMIIGLIVYYRRNRFVKSYIALKNRYNDLKNPAFIEELIKLVDKFKNRQSLEELEEIGNIFYETANYKLSTKYYSEYIYDEEFKKGDNKDESYYMIFIKCALSDKYSGNGQKAIKKLKSIDSIFPCDIIELNDFYYQVKAIVDSDIEY